MARNRNSLDDRNYLIKFVRKIRESDFDGAWRLYSNRSNILREMSTAGLFRFHRLVSSNGNLRQRIEVCVKIGLLERGSFIENRFRYCHISYGLN